MTAQKMPNTDPDRSPPTTPPAPAVPGSCSAGDVVGGYELVWHVHGGAFGQVWVGRDLLLGDRCAVKVVPDGLAGRVELEGVQQYKRVADRNDGLVPIHELGVARQGVLLHHTPGR
jgi:hypothetical protein